MMAFSPEVGLDTTMNRCFPGDMRRSAPALLLAAALATGCPGWPAPPSKPDPPWLEPLDQAEILMFQQGAWLSPELFTPGQPGGARGQVVESPWVSFNISADTEIGRERVTLELGTDSSKIAMMPAHGCFEGLTPADLVPLTAAGPPERGCRERGYGHFRVCPGDPALRMPIYLAAWSLHDYQGKVLQRRRLLTPQEVAGGAKGAQPLSQICGKQRWVTAVPLPVELQPHGRIRMRLRLKLILDARRADPALGQLTYLRVQAVNK